MLQSLFTKSIRLLSNDVGIDLGTTNTLVYIRDYGIVVNEPSVVALNQKTDQIVAVGTTARQMLGRTPSHIRAVRPLVDGVISDFDVAEEMMRYFLGRVRDVSRKLVRPRVLVGIPSGVTNVEMRAVRDAAKDTGAREVHIIEEPMAAAIGIGMPIHDPVGNMIIDIGGGTTDIAVISLGGIVRSKNIRVAGDKFNEDIASYIRNEFQILIGDRTAEEIKIAIGSVHGESESIEAAVRGRDLVSGLPREVVITDADIREAITPSITTLVESAKEVLEETPPEVLSDVMARGIVLVGGGSAFRGLAELLNERLRVAVYIAHDPLTAVVRGTGNVLENLDTYRDVLRTGEDELQLEE